MSSRYSHARQMKRAKVKTLKNYPGRVIRDVKKNGQRINNKLDESLQRPIDPGERVYQQSRYDKVYSLHEREVGCIAKGKARTKYEFGSKVGLAVTGKGGWVLGAMAFEGNPYDGHTLTPMTRQLEQHFKRKSCHYFVDRGYRGHHYQGNATVHVDKARRGKTPKRLWKWMKQRVKVEVCISHVKNEHRMNRCYLKGVQGDRINAVLSASGFNIRKLIAHFADNPLSRPNIAPDYLDDYSSIFKPFSPKYRQ